LQSKALFSSQIEFTVLSPSRLNEKIQGGRTGREESKICSVAENRETF
jgi:hypothetical protein